MHRKNTTLLIAVIGALLVIFAVTTTVKQPGQRTAELSSGGAVSAAIARFPVMGGYPPEYTEAAQTGDGWQVMFKLKELNLQITEAHCFLVSSSGEVSETGSYRYDPISSVIATRLYPANCSIDTQHDEWWAIGLVKASYPDMSAYPCDAESCSSLGNLPRYIVPEEQRGTWHLAFVQTGSGVPIISAQCFSVGTDGTVSKTGDYSTAKDGMRATISAMNCS